MLPPICDCSAAPGSGANSRPPSRAIRRSSAVRNPASTSMRQTSGSNERTRFEPLEREDDAAVERNRAAGVARAAAARDDRRRRSRNTTRRPPQPPRPCGGGRPLPRGRAGRAPRSDPSGRRRSAQRPRRRPPREGHARSTRRQSCECALERVVPVLEHGLAVRDEHHLDRQVEQRLQPRAEVVLRVAAEMAQPRFGTQAQPRRPVAEDAVARDERSCSGNPEDRLACAGDLESPRRPRARRPKRCSAASARSRLRSCHGTVMRIATCSLVAASSSSAPIVAVDHERIDQHERARAPAYATQPTSAGQSAGLSSCSRGFPLRMRAPSSATTPGRPGASPQAERR